MAPNLRPRLTAADAPRPGPPHPPPGPGSRTHCPEVTKLLLRCYRKETRAQHELYRRYYPFALNVARHYAGDRMEADDLVQDGFIRLFRRLASEPFTGAFEAYFRRLLVNASIDRFREAQRRRGLLERLRAQPTVRTTENAGLRALEAADVARFLQRLTPGYRIVFNLFVVEGLTHPEIAERLGISVGTSKSNLAKARRTLRAIAGPYFSSETAPTHE